MPTEIERRFLIEEPFAQPRVPGVSIKQGYLSLDPRRTVRVRGTHYGGGDAVGTLTIKGKKTGAAAPEFEYEIPRADAEDLLKLRISKLIEKTRYKMRFGDHDFDVDFFHGEHQGLVIAEVELDSEDEEVSVPEWFGKEITDDPAYSNAQLSRHLMRPGAGKISL